MKTQFCALVAGCFLAAGFSASATSQEWPQYRGPNHDAISSEKILSKWPAEGLKTLWKVPMNAGFSAISVGGGKAFTLITREVNGADQEVCVGLDAATGKELWVFPVAIANYDPGAEKGAPGNDGGDGPRSTPAYDDGKVYVYSSSMVLVCMDAETGKRIWSSNIIKDHGGRNIHWESAASPVVDGDLVFIAGGGPGESLLAFDKKDGHVVWKTGDERFTQSTPVVADILGERQVIFFTQSGLVSLKTTDGSELWRYSFPYKSAAGMSPVVAGDVVYCSVAYGVGSGACKITKADGKFTATKLWFQPANVINNHWSTPVYHDGYLYGLFGQAQFGRAPLDCVDIKTGEVVWSKPGFGPGGVILADGHLMVLSDAGDLVLVDANPKAYNETARAHILSGKCWNGVGLSHGLVYARSTKEGACLSVAP